MAKDMYISLYFNKGELKEVKEVKQGANPTNPPPLNTVTDVGKLEAISRAVFSGDLKPIGVLYQGKNPSATADAASTCIIVNLGGTVYEICY